MRARCTVLMKKDSWLLTGIRDRAEGVLTPYSTDAAVRSKVAAAIEKVWTFWSERIGSLHRAAIASNTHATVLFWGCGVGYEAALVSAIIKYANLQAVVRSPPLVSRLRLSRSTGTISGSIYHIFGGLSAKRTRFVGYFSLKFTIQESSP